VNHFDIAHSFTARAEGGYVSNPGDPGGPTKYGVSLRLLRSFGIDIDRDGDIDQNDVRDLTPAQAEQLLHDVKQAVLDLDLDLTLAYSALNTLGTALALKIDAAVKDVAGGVAGLDASGLLKAAQFPSSAVLPVGSLLLWSTGSVPANYLECNGAQLSTSDYPDLFNAIQYAYGGSGLIFNLPDWRGMFPRGWDHGRLQDPDATARAGGDAVGSTQGDAMIDHQLEVPAGTFYAAAGAGGPCFQWGVASPGQWTDAAGWGGNPGQAKVSAYETRPVNMNVMFCIKWR